MSIDADLRASIAVTRFGLGAKAGEIDAARADPRGWLKAQITPAGADQPAGDFAGAAQRVDALQMLKMDRRDIRQTGQAPASSDIVKDAQKVIRADAGTEFLSRAALAAQTDAAFRERWALFWFNHFTVAAKNIQTGIEVGPFEREAIRPHVFGAFEDMLVASSSHPGMLLFLDQAQSIGPNSPAARNAQLRAKFKAGGLNENLGREVMELHTVGVRSGYTQGDVTEFARALTGWSIVGPNENRPPAPGFGGGDGPGSFVFRPFAHEPGDRHIVGRTYPAGGVEQARAVLHDLAHHPATAHHIAVKLARHFVADDPPPTLVARLDAAFKISGGRLDHVARVLIDSPEAWTPEARKFKSPYEFLISGYRAAGQTPGQEIAPVLTNLGQKPFSASSPKGWPEDAQAWASPDGVIKRMAWSESFAAKAAPLVGQPIELAQNTLGARLSPATATAVSRAESRPEAFSILLMSPEFQRR